MNLPHFPTPYLTQSDVFSSPFLAVCNPNNNQCHVTFTPFADPVFDPVWRI